MSFTIHGAQPRGVHTVEIGVAHLRQAPQSIVLDVGASLVEVKTERDSGEMVELVVVDVSRPEDSNAPLLLSGVTEFGVPLMSYGESGTGRLYVWDSPARGWSVRTRLDRMTQLRTACGLAA
ncbi:hypothetical protein ACFC4C_21370 [Streptomyces sp. NPDC056039]|uniref:hypothetical protein n=1 Tax=Streptomyces sp. NPDC056039 TaxID=3345687 RepID=UPI0035D555D6